MVKKIIHRAVQAAMGCTESSITWFEVHSPTQQQQQNENHILSYNQMHLKYQRFDFCITSAVCCLRSWCFVLPLGLLTGYMDSSGHEQNRQSIKMGGCDVCCARADCNKCPLIMKQVQMLFSNESLSSSVCRASELPLTFHLSVQNR